MNSTDASGSLRALVADDERHSVRVVQARLERRGYAATSAFNGREAIDFLSRDRFALVVLDPRLPEVSGYAVRDWIMANELNRDAEVVMLEIKDGSRRMTFGWILLIALGAIGLAGLMLWRLSRGTIYIFGPSGFVGHSIGRSNTVHTLSDGQLDVVVKRLLTGESFDHLWVSTQNDDMTGVIIALESGGPRLSLFLFTHRERAQVESARQAMRDLGCALEESSEDFNGGGAEEDRTTILEANLPNSSEAVAGAVRRVLRVLDPRANSTYYATASRQLKFTGSSGIEFEPKDDPLSDLP